VVEAWWPAREEEVVWGEWLGDEQQEEEVQEDTYP
jgi:hypothetical protein